MPTIIHDAFFLSSVFLKEIHRHRHGGRLSRSAGPVFPRPAVRFERRRKPPASRGGQRGRAASEPSDDNNDISTEFTASGPVGQRRGRAGVGECEGVAGAERPGPLRKARRRSGFLFNNLLLRSCARHGCRLGACHWREGRFPPLSNGRDTGSGPFTPRGRGCRERPGLFSGHGRVLFREPRSTGLRAACPWHPARPGWDSPSP